MKKVAVSIPHAWHELNLQQLYSLSRLFIKNFGEKDFLVKCFLKLSGWKLLRKKEFVEAGKSWFWFKSKENGKFLVDGDVYTDLVKKLDWIIKAIHPVSVLPEFGRYKAINIRLFGVSLDEYLFIEKAYTNFVKSKKPQYLNRLVAIVYRKKGEAWDSSILNKKVRRFWIVPYFKKYLVFIWFSGIKTWMKAKYPFVWQSGDSAPLPDDEVILNLLSSLNNGDITANKEIFKTHVHEAFYELNLKAERVANSKTK